jgi:predicted site-specific integrase-resolvase
MSINMKSNQALKILRVSKSTLRNYIKSGKIKATKLPTGRYDYVEKKANLRI